MQGHEHFEELSALAAIGQLSAQEHSELLDHLKGCYSCRRATDDFAVVLDQLPLTEPEITADDTEKLQTSSYRQRFLQRARGEGIRFSSEALQGRGPRLGRKLVARRTGYVLVPAFAALIVVAVLGHLPTRLPIEQDEAVQAAPVVPVAIQSQPDPYQQILAELESRYRNSQDRVVELEAKLARTLQELSAVRSLAEHDTNQAVQRTAKLKEELRTARTSLAQASAESERLRKSRDELTATLVEQQIQMNELNQQAKEQATAVERERQLAGLAGDLRGLMGARNLHIIDVFDADGRGRAKKSFGRVFYVEGQSLIFYAFDLSQKGGGDRKVSFQAWGQREAVRNVAKNLGVFHIDDREQKRWVLKVSDPEKLRAIDSVFVTVERFGGSERPTGEKLLYAYLGTQANHP